MTTGTKPPYKIPLMSEIDQMPFNGYKAISTFSGCGGGCLGLRLAGFKIIWANEFIYAAAESYRANFPNTFVDPRDIRIILAEEIMEKLQIQKGELDLLEGSPPCADFSMSGKRVTGKNKLKKYSSTKQKVDDLFWEYARLLNDLQPKAFIAENVRGLAQGDIGTSILGSPQMGFFDQHKETIFYALSSAGYKVDYRILNADRYGVPQSRERLFIIGVRNDLPTFPIFPQPYFYKYTAREALEGVNYTVDDILDAKIPTFAAKFIRMLKPGECISDYHPKQAGWTSRRLDPDKPCSTIMAEVARGSNIFHPTEDRLLTIPELIRLHSFPDDFKLVGNFEQNGERIGRSVPPLLMYHIAKTIKEEILDV